MAVTTFSPSPLLDAHRRGQLEAWRVMRLCRQPYKTPRPRPASDERLVMPGDPDHKHLFGGRA